VEPIEFLSFEDVIDLHAEQLARYGGREGFVDENVVRSAVAMPQATMFGNYLHEDIAEMAAAYLFHFAAAQGFSDGNKRTALASSVEFLARNGYTLNCSDLDVYEMTLRVANHQMEKPEIADWIRDRLEPIA
jgi:death-on-curing protein